jgi:hypothetical protein
MSPQIFKTVIHASHEEKEERRMMIKLIDKQKSKNKDETEYWQSIIKLLRISSNIQMKHSYSHK